LDITVKYSFFTPPHNSLHLWGETDHWNSTITAGYSTTFTHTCLQSVLCRNYYANACVFFSINNKRWWIIHTNLAVFSFRTVLNENSDWNWWNRIFTHFASGCYPSIYYLRIFTSSVKKATMFAQNLMLH
jgi:hypothetical protein